MNIEADKIGQAIQDNHGTINQHVNLLNQPQSLPNSIPSTSGFVGRADYLADLHKYYQNGSRSFVLYGTGGVGKTATALKFAEEIAGNYAAKIRVEMNGMSENPLSARDAMLNIVRQFDREIRADISDAELKNLFISKVQNQPTLIVLDNADNESQIAPLINVKDACFIVSSRNYIELATGKTKRLGAMSPKDAESLLISIAGEEKFEGRAGELAKMAGYLPMALKPLAKLLKNKFKTINDILKEYEDEKKRLEITDAEHDNLSVEASFALSYDALSPEMQEYWRRLSVFPADFEKQAASTVFGTGFEEGWNILLRLYDYSLIEEDSTSTNAEPRFNIHDLAREFANKQLSEDERFNAQLRHSFYYTLILRCARDIELNHREIGSINALQLIDTEWTNILAGQDWAAKFLNRNNDAAELCADYAGLVTDLLSFRLPPRQEIIWFRAALAAANKFQNEQIAGVFLGSLGKAYSNVGDYDVAISYLNKSLAIAQRFGDTASESASLGNLGNIYSRQQNKRKAANFARKALKISHFTNDIKGQCIHLNNLGTALLGYEKRYEKLIKRIKRNRSVWWYQTAFEYLKQAMLIADKIGNLEVAGGSRSNIGRIYLMLPSYKSFQKAKELFEQALEIQRKINNPFGIALGLANLGCACIGVGEKERACGLWKEALVIFESLEAPDAIETRQWLKENCENQC